MKLARSSDLSVWGLLSGDDNVRGDLPVPALEVAGLGVAGLVVDEVVAGRGSTSGPGGGCRTRSAGGLPPGRCAWLLSAPAGAAPGEHGALGGQLAGARGGRSE